MRHNHIVCCSCWVISKISAVVGSTGVFGGGLYRVDGDGNVDIKEKDRIVYGAIYGTLLEIMLVIGIPGWRHSHATSEENDVK